MIEKKRSKGVTFWGYTLSFVGIVYGVIIAVRNVWGWVIVLTPIFLIVVGMGILNLNNWARRIMLIYAICLVISGILFLPQNIREIIRISQMGPLAIPLVGFIMRFVLGIGGIFFFTNRSVKEQFREGGES